MLKNKTVFITGASSGIGAACANTFAAAGANLILCARRREILEHFAQQLMHDHGVKVHVLQMDIRQHELVNQAFTSLPAEWCNIDILVNNAGLAAGLDPVQEGNIQDWEDMIDTNVKGLLYVTRAILPRMVEKNSGHIINIGSIAGHEVYEGGTVYCATKFAVKALSAGLRHDLFGTKIRVSNVDPGAVESNFSVVRFKGNEERAAAIYEGMDALMPNDVADAVLYCATRPPHVNISEMLLMSTDQVGVSKIARRE